MSFSMVLIAASVAAAQPDKAKADKPLAVAVKDAAAAGDYKGDWQVDTPAFKAFVDKYDGKLVSATGVITLGADKSLIHAVGNGKTLVRFVVVPNKDGVNDKYAHSRTAGTVGFPSGKVAGSAVGTLKVDGTTVKIEDAILTPFTSLAVTGRKK